MAKYPAAFINMIAESGTKQEVIKQLQETWDELQDVKARAAWLRACERADQVLEAANAAIQSTKRGGEPNM